jgi:hypothetical protein
VNYWKLQRKATNEWVARSGNNQLSPKSNADPLTEKLINAFYQLIVDHSNKTKLLEQFKSTGKGGIIELEGEPIFPLKMTLDYLLMDYNRCVFKVTNTRIQDSLNKYDSPRRAFKESKNINNMSNNLISSKLVEIQGRVQSGCEDKGSFTHRFEIKNGLINKLLICS